MSELAKRIGRIQRREVTGGMGFAATKREAPRAMLLAVRAADAAAAKAAFEAGADAVILDNVEPGSVGEIVKAVGKGIAGITLPALDEQVAASLHEAGSDFVISPLATTASAAVDTDQMGQVVSLTSDITDASLRSLGPLGFDAIFVEGSASAVTLADQLELVRLASFSGLPLAVNVEPDATVGQVRVLRDSGAVMAVAPTGTTPEQVKALVETLIAVPPPRKSGRGGDIALVPASAQHGHEEDDEVEEPQ